MRKFIFCFTFSLLAVGGHSFRVCDNDDSQVGKEKGGVTAMDKQMFLDRIFDYERSSEWNFKGEQPVIIDFYANWCPPCRKIAPVMEELSKEYDKKIKIYKVNVDKEKELAAFFQAKSIPLLVFIPTDGEPKLFPGAAEKATYKQIIDSFLLGETEE